MTPFLLLMPSYNQSCYILEAIRSIQRQDDPDWQLWIVDNSTDDTPAVVAQVADPRIRFHHIEQRMDPGSCLNWMLERVQGRDFSYVHTDNNLDPRYVRCMREALSSHPLGLAYCDYRVIDDDGRRVQVIRRGAFSPAQLFSLRPLGVPFSGTLELARRLGGFSCADVADDVYFCARAAGLAHYTYLREPLLDYRVHRRSRTTLAGGDPGVFAAYLRSHMRAMEVLQQRGQPGPLAEMAREIGEAFDDIDWLLEDIWYRYLERHGARWTGGAPPDLDGFFRAGLLALPCPGSGQVRYLRPASTEPLYRASGLTPVHRLRMHLKLDRDLRRRASHLRDLLVPWAYMSMGAPAQPMLIAAENEEARTLWATELIRHELVSVGPARESPGSGLRMSLRVRPSLAISVLPDATGAHVGARYDAPLANQGLR